MIFIYEIDDVWDILSDPATFQFFFSSKQWIQKCQNFQIFVRFNLPPLPLALPFPKHLIFS